MKDDSKVFALGNWKNGVAINRDGKGTLRVWIWIYVHVEMLTRHPSRDAE